MPVYKTVQTLIVLCAILSTITIPLVMASEDYWTTLEPMPTARNSFAVAVANDKIYAIGGYNGSNNYLAVNEMYDSATDTWTTKQPMPTARTGAAAAVFNNKIYVIGGIFAASDPTYSGYTGITEVYDPLTDTWETKEPMPTACSDLDANVVGDKIYLIAGIKYGSVYPFIQYNDKNQVYDPIADSWSTKTPIPTGFEGYASAVVDNKIYVMGAGLNQIYDPETDTWASGTASPTHLFFSGGGATSGELAPKRIYVLGGLYPYTNTHTNFTQVYDPESDTWTYGTPMLTPRNSFGVAVVNDELYAIGGRTTGAIFSAANEKYTPTDYIPEFPSWIILPLILIVSLVVVIVRNRLRRKLAS